MVIFFCCNKDVYGKLTDIDEINLFVYLFKSLYCFTNYQAFSLYVLYQTSLIFLFFSSSGLLKLTIKQWQMVASIGTLIERKIWRSLGFSEFADELSHFGGNLGVGSDFQSTLADMQ